MAFNENQARRPVFSLMAVYRYFCRRAVNRKTVRLLRELNPEQLKDIGLSKHDLSHWD